MKNQIKSSKRGNSNELLTPQEVWSQCKSSTDFAVKNIESNRDSIKDIVSGQSDRLLIIVGPCSIHNPEEAIEYARKLVKLREELSPELEVVMRVYFEKPRTTVGWKGLINDPDLDSSFQINKGLCIARELLVDITEIGLPVACEFLDMITPQYIYDLVSWGAIGARTTESQIHRELASSLPFPIGFKNGTDGNINIAVDAVRAANSRHHMLSIDHQGKAVFMDTIGNANTHVILRGGHKPNYDSTHVNESIRKLNSFQLTPQIMIDCSHGNSSKDYTKQASVCEDVCKQISEGESGIMGLMIESNLVGGKQELLTGKPLEFGQSITDGCVGWEETEIILRKISATVAQLRAKTR
ncbi:3-deoxy-7-phosphoheptulonate synthase [Vibrio sp. THAF190c]|uniref:3-deoxy-7-phosphoheptulonate synthase n=1 Tax=Vibrio sp. THAF190c TaxID=2587865 RepID=UPI001268FC95|nr:3-deoxy-7-phosphoheptulonate synthase [Vibrio sp. THAF190c]QFT08548.1 Phospho-2-dehydro-3-deoxyheptonate aldolase, Phe-sensitive [Vibrio sp. THAF190c]